MTNMRELYQEMILEHNKNPRNYGELANQTHGAEGHNPLCGDYVRISLNINNDTINDIHFNGEGCAICKASASIMTTMIKNQNKSFINNLMEEFRGMIVGEFDPEIEENHLGRLKVFANIKTLPVRVKCAILPWHTLKAAMNNETNVTTE